MSAAVLQFFNIVAMRFAQIELAKMEREQDMLNILKAELDGTITSEQATDARLALSAADDIPTRPLPENWTDK